jgi:hypothetical protein
MSYGMPRFNGRTIDIEDLLVWAFRDEDVEDADDPDPDAVTVYWAVMALPMPHARAITRFARLGASPDWHPTGHTVSLDGVRRARTLHAEWVRAMVVLQHTLDGTLSRYRVNGPRREEEPWIRHRRLIDQGVSPR